MRGLLESIINDDNTSAATPSGVCGDPGEFRPAKDADAATAVADVDVVARDGMWMGVRVGPPPRRDCREAAGVFASPGASGLPPPPVFADNRATSRPSISGVAGEAAAGGDAPLIVFG